MSNHVNNPRSNPFHAANRPPTPYPGLLPCSAIPLPPTYAAALQVRRNPTLEGAWWTTPSVRTYPTVKPGAERYPSRIPLFAGLRYRSIPSATPSSAAPYNGDTFELSCNLSDVETASTNSARVYKLERYGLLTEWADDESRSPLSPAPSPHLQSRLWLESLPTPNTSTKERYPKRIALVRDDDSVATGTPWNAISTTSKASTVSKARTASNASTTSVASTAAVAAAAAAAEDAAARRWPRYRTQSQVDRDEERLEWARQAVRDSQDSTMRVWDCVRRANEFSREYVNTIGRNQDTMLEQSMEIRWLKLKVAELEAWIRWRQMAR